MNDQPQGRNCTKPPGTDPGDLRVPHVHPEQPPQKGTTPANPKAAAAMRRALAAVRALPSPRKPRRK